MKKKVLIWAGIAVLAVVLLAATAFIFKDRLFASGASEEHDEPVMVQAAATQELGESILVTGQIIPSDEQKVFHEAENGEVKEFLVSENQVIEADTPLYAYDDSAVNSEYNKAVRTRDLTNKRLAIANDELTAARRQLNDMKKNKDVTKEELSAASKEIVQLEMDIEGIKDEIGSAQQAIDELAVQKEKLTVKSKIAGTVVKVNKNVEPSENGSAEPVVHIISSGPFKVIGTMSEFDTVKVKPEQPVVIRPKVFKDQTWEGSIESISQFPEGDQSAMDEYGGGGGNVTMYPFTVTIAGDTKELRQGFHVSLEINVSDLEQSEQLAIPHMALDMDDEGNEFVYVISQENILEKRPVVLGEMNDEFAGVAEGLEPGDLVVTNPYVIAMKNLEPGQEVPDFMTMDEGMEDPDTMDETETETEMETEPAEDGDAPEETEPEDSESEEA
ncbi:efflux RND transporter periplasmic adaptor subunit [Bhargavaea beijingensis]|uniref:HlyD family secretion protein n=1 Tax=Bhargavaea beijingensis TaxID=426756 RepID=A0A1G7E5K5_9BACL|nr:efflux RND transporter periplasmic adaptor subunit [Bhargavaea beijingensis]MCW1927517.1 efflux RND transporter periplasmic adaptor subunit [Bhargavaea beijingensis]SDE58952.1 HlyD family secretion protein [Bhargavaea beijingensis]